MSVLLGEVLRKIEVGEFPTSDGTVTVVPAPSPGTSAVVVFTGHAVIAADVDDAWLRDHVCDGDLSAPLNPPFLSALETRLGRRVNNIDMVTVATPLDGPAPVPLTRVSDLTHPRVERAQRYRHDLRVWFTSGGVLVLGRGLAGRWEVAIEVDPVAREHGLGQALAKAARHVAPADHGVWAQIAPGNAASVRAFLAAGFVPVGAEALLVQ